MAKGSIKQFLQQKIGRIPCFLIYVLLEWIIIAILFIDGLIAFAANEFARFFDLKIPCLLCTRIDHVLVHRDPGFYYNDSICEAHRKDVSSLAYCHIHQRLSDIRQMCEGCLLSFATENQSNCDTYKSLVGILGGDLECSVEDDHKIHLRLPAAGEDQIQLEKSKVHRCSCCGEPLKVKATFQQALAQTQKHPNDGLLPHAPAPSPRGFVMTKNDELRSTTDTMSHIRYTELKFMSDTESELPEDEFGNAGAPISQSKEDPKAATVPLLTESEDSPEDSCRTPSFVRTQRFMGMNDSPTATPRGHLRFRRFLADKAEMNMEGLEGNPAIESDGEAILLRLKTQVRLDRKSLIALYMELDEERSASAVAANQAMAMITRLQAEKAAVQMEALQYQRLMEEQAEYDQEAVQVLKNQLIKKEERIKLLVSEVKNLRLKMGFEEPFEIEGCKEDDDSQKYKYRSNSTLSQISECGSTPCHSHFYDDEMFNRSLDQTGPSQAENGSPVTEEDPILDQESEKIYLLERLRMLEKIHSASNRRDRSSTENSETNNNEDSRDGSEADVTREISHLAKRMEAIENDREFLKHAFQSLQKGDEGTQLLREIAQHLRDLRHVDKAEKGKIMEEGLKDLHMISTP